MSCDKSQHIPVSKLWDGLHPLGFKKGQFVILKGYMDESGDGDLFTLSCLISNGDIWRLLENDWVECLQAKNRELEKAGRQRLSRYHAADCSNMVNEFSGWDITEQVEFAKALLRIFNNFRLVNYSYGMNLHEMVSEIPATAPNPERFGYVLFLMMILLDINDKVLKKNPGMLIRLFHDRCKYDAALLQAYEHVIDAPFLENRHRFLGLAPEGWEYCVPLQPADLMAYENFKDLDRRYKGRKRRKSLNSILTNGRLGGGAIYYDRDGMRSLRRMFDELDDYTKEILLAMARVKKQR